MLTSAYAAINDTVDAKGTIAAQLAIGPLDNYCQIVQIFMNLQNSAGGTASLMRDTATLTTVKAIASDTLPNFNTGQFDVGTASAQAVLREVLQLPDYAIYVAPYAIPVENHRPNKLGNNDNSTQQSAFNLFPNPNNGNFSMKYSLNSDETGSIELYNYMGDKIRTYNLDPNSTMLQINEPDLSAGMYFYRVFVNGQVQNIGKIVIIK